MLNRIKEFRVQKKMSLAALEDATGISAQQLNRLEKGERRLNEDNLRIIAKALGCRPQDLIATTSNYDEQGVSQSPSDKPIDKKVWNTAEEAVVKFWEKLPPSEQKKMTRKRLMVLLSWAYEEAWEQHSKKREIYISDTFLRSYMDRILRD